MYNIPDRRMANRQFQEAAAVRKAANDTQYFWDLVNRAKSGTLHVPTSRKVNQQAEEKLLFGKKAESETNGGMIDENIPVERSGPRADEVPALESFADLINTVPPFVMKNIELMNYEKPTPIQKHSVPLGLAGIDLMCCAQTGSGKTFAFLMPVVCALDTGDAKARFNAGTRASNDANTDITSNSAITNPDEDSGFSEFDRIGIDHRGVLPRSIILAPTRELALQIHMDAKRLLFGSHLKTVCVYGGNDVRSQLVELATGCDVIVATPGRLNDLVDRGVVSLSQVSFLVLDEADRMLDMGFEPQIRRIVQESDMPGPGDRQTFMFSATFPDEIQTMAREFLYEYVWVGVGRVGSTVENIKQQVLMASSDVNEKMRLLEGVINQTNGRTLIFVQKRRTATWLCDCLKSMYGLSAEEIHGDRTQSQRENALKHFREGTIQFLVATDVAARGLDVPAVTHVIQFDMPLSSEDFDVYVHRIGRTGRAGKAGLATAFYVPGREPGEGNGKIAQQILRLLKENNQEIPEWFSSLDDLHLGPGARGNQYQNRRQQPYGQQKFGANNRVAGAGNYKFGWRDARGDQEATMYRGGASNYGAVPGSVLPQANMGYMGYATQQQQMHQPMQQQYQRGNSGYNQMPYQQTQQMRGGYNKSNGGGRGYGGGQYDYRTMQQQSYMQGGGYMNQQSMYPGAGSPHAASEVPAIPTTVDSQASVYGVGAYGVPLPQAAGSPVAGMMGMSPHMPVANQSYYDPYPQSNPYSQGQSTGVDPMLSSQFGNMSVQGSQWDGGGRGGIGAGGGAAMRHGHMGGGRDMGAASHQQARSMAYNRPYNGSAMYTNGSAAGHHYPSVPTASGMAGSGAEYDYQQQNYDDGTYGPHAGGYGESGEGGEGFGSKHQDGDHGEA